MSEKPSKIDRLHHILEAIDRILKFVEEMEYEDFVNNEMAQFAVIKNFEIIGEAAYYLPKEYRIANGQVIEWRKIIAFRHILVHDYYKINTAIVWKAIRGKLIDLKGEIEKLAENE
ncbi:MAG: HepT-like ribonuclease domain-containing protein [Bacteroidota bacterium]